MFSTLVGCYQGNNMAYGHLNRAATCVDFTALVTMVVAGVLAISENSNLPIGYLPIGSSNGYTLIAAGTVGLIVLAIKNVKGPSSGIPEYSDLSN